MAEKLQYICFLKRYGNVVRSKRIIKRLGLFLILVFLLNTSGIQAFSILLSNIRNNFYFVSTHYAIQIPFFWAENILENDVDDDVYSITAFSQRIHSKFAEIYIQFCHYFFLKQFSPSLQLSRSPPVKIS